MDQKIFLWTWRCNLKLWNFNTENKEPKIFFPWKNCLMENFSQLFFQLRKNFCGLEYLKPLFLNFEFFTLQGIWRRIFSGQKSDYPAICQQILDQFSKSICFFSLKKFFSQFQIFGSEKIRFQLFFKYQYLLIITNGEQNRDLSNDKVSEFSFWKKNYDRMSLKIIIKSSAEKWNYYSSQRPTNNTVFWGFLNLISSNTVIDKNNEKHIHQYLSWIFIEKEAKSPYFSHWRDHFLNRFWRDCQIIFFSSFWRKILQIPKFFCCFLFLKTWKLDKDIPSFHYFQKDNKQVLFEIIEEVIILKEFILL